jgi:hypothetical protein
MLHDPGLCPRCNEPMMQMTSWQDTREQYWCLACRHRETGPPTDPDDIQRSKAEAFAMLLRCEDE